MNKITYKRVTLKRLDDAFLNGYIRFKETKRVVFQEEEDFKEKNYFFREDWDQKKLISISRQLKEIVKNGGYVYAAYDYKQIVGFAAISSERFFDNVINLPYLHTSKGYRGYGIGKMLFYLVCGEALQHKVKKLYISTHPDVDTQAFYTQVDCVKATKINQRLYKEEPFDIHLEKDLDYYDVITNLMKLAFNTNQRVTAKVIGQVASKYYRYLPKDTMEFLQLCKRLLNIDTYGYFSVATLWMKRNRLIVDEKYMEFFEEVLFDSIEGWAQVDQYCYRVLNPVIELNRNFYEYLLNWSSSNNKNVRRASLVSMIRSSQNLTLEYDYDKMIFLVEKLKNDNDFHVKKAVGWVLKCAYPTYPEKIEMYLRENVNTLNRMIFRYALEHIPEEQRSDLIKL